MKKTLPGGGFFPWPSALCSGGSSSGDEPTRVGAAAPDSSTGPRPVPVPLGPSIEGYTLKEEIHRGGQGVVYRAIQLGTKRQVALKVLLEGPFASENSRRRFEREVELAASLRHPNIVTILDSGLSQGRYYFAMEYIDGLRLDRFVAQRKPPLGDLLRLYEKVCLAINFAHQRGVIHRDLKPPNILVDAEGEPHILDFGLAKPVHLLAGTESTVRVLSTSGQLLGTVAYMSPEQAAGSADVDVRSDVYALGVIFYEALLGHPPYVVDGPLGEVLDRIANDEPDNPRGLPSLAAGGARVDDEIATILLKALEKEPQRRYQTAGDLARDLHRRLSGEPIEAKRASGLYMLKKTLRRYRWHAATAGAALLVLLGFLVALGVLLAREREARRRADEQAEYTRQAVARQQEALQETQARTADALLSQRNLRQALVRQHIQRGDLALQRSHLAEARDSYWQALDVGPSPAANWALRRYYLQTSESQAALAVMQPFGPARLSPDGELAAVCPTPDSIAVRLLRSGALAGWVRTPGPVELLDVQDDGSLAAGGEDWVRAWGPGTFRPSLAAQWPAGDRPHAIYAVDGGQRLLVVGQRSASLLAQASGQLVGTVALSGTPAGKPDYAPQLRQLAIPTTAGVELVSLGEAGEMRADVVWTGAAPARAVRFDGDEAVAVLSDAVFLARLADLAGRGATPARSSSWTRVIGSGTDWDLFDLKTGMDLIVFATHSGRLAMYRSGELVGALSNSVDRLEQLRCSAQDQAAVTLDGRGVVTYWGEPQRIQQRRLIHPTAPTLWVTAADGSVTLLAVTRGQVIAYAPQYWPQPRTVLRPRLMGFGDEDIAMAVSDDGQRAVIRDRMTVRLVTLPDLAARSFTWNDAAFALPDKVALSGDGELLAILARNPLTDQQRIVLKPWGAAADASGAQRSAAGQGGQDTASVSLDMAGALVRDIAFLPGGRQLLVARSNGQLLLLDAGNAWRADGPDQSRPAAEPWMQLDSPPTVLAFSRTAEYLAAACEDGVTRLVAVPQRELRKRLSLRQPVSALAFNPHDDVLLVRGTDGSVHLFDPAAGEELTSWQLPVRSDRPLGAWVGDASDGLLLSQDTGVYEYRFAEADAVIERNRPFAREMKIDQCLADADWPAAWAAATSLRTLHAGRGEYAQVVVVEAALRRPGTQVPPEWLDAVLTGAPAAVFLRLGHAAYEGQRFELAGRWLQHGLELAGGTIDALSEWELAGCEYLAQEYGGAAQRLEAVLSRPELDPALTPIAGLLRVSALVLAGRASEARQAALQVGAADAWGRRGDRVAATSASMIARVIAGIERESIPFTLAESAIAEWGPRAALFREDRYFFAGELARQRGDLAQAAAEYQRCIDLARDAWPANWARHRLRALR